MRLVFNLMTQMFSYSSNKLDCTCTAERIFLTVGKRGGGEGTSTVVACIIGPYSSPCPESIFAFQHRTCFTWKNEVCQFWPESQEVLHVSTCPPVSLPLPWEELTLGGWCPFSLGPTTQMTYRYEERSNVAPANLQICANIWLLF